MRTLREVLDGKEAVIFFEVAGKLNYYLLSDSSEGWNPDSLYPTMRLIYFVQAILGAGSLYVSHYVLLFITYLLWIRLRLLKKERVLHDRELVLLEKYKALFTNMPLAYMKHRLIYNAKGDVVDYQVEEVNPMFEECFAKAEKVVGKKGSELRGSRYNEFVVLYKKMFIEKKSFTFEYYC
ncbi:MAG: hybrid sensor histidine kinase/response regulator, partial [Butyricimonas faecihominis]